MAICLHVHRNSGIVGPYAAFEGLFSSLPGHNLLWPYRFQGVCGFLLLLSGMWFLKMMVMKPKSVIITLMLLVVLLADMGISQRLIGMRSPRENLLIFTTRMGEQPGWREIIDKSRLVRATYFVDVTARCEQVFGWGYQGHERLEKWPA
jgi:hypothetical protein